MFSARRNSFAHGTGALLGILLSGCVTVHTTKEIATAPVAAGYGRGDSARNVPVAQLDTRSLDAVSASQEAWWQQFDDQRLNRLMEQVLKANKDLASAGLRLQQARLRAGLAFDDLLPHLDASASAGYSRPLTGENQSTSHSYGASAGISYEIDLWRRLRGQHDIAKWEVQATAEDLESTRLALIGDTCNLYWTLAFLNQRIVAGDESLARVEKTQQLVNSQFKAGAVSRLEVREAEQNLQSQRAGQSALIQQRIETRNALTLLLDGTPWPLEDEPADLRNASMPEIREGVPAELLGRRPDLRAAELRLRETLTGVDITRVSYYPSLNLSGGVGTGGPTLSDVLSNPVATLGAGLVLPFLRFNERRLNIALASKDYEIAANAFRNTLYRAFTEVDNSLSANTQLAAQLEASQESYEEAVEIERLYSVRYRAGDTALRNWLDAQETRRSADLSLAQARLSQLQNYSTLFQALGGRP